MKFKEKVIEAVKGFFIGLAILLPGVSGGTIAIVTKLYNKITTNIANLLKHFWTAFKNLLPIGIGVLISLPACWLPLKYASEYIKFAMVSLFAGFVIGSIPELTDTIKGEEFRKRDYLYIILAILVGCAFGILSANVKVESAQINELFKTNHIFWVIIPVGIFAAIGIIVPGASGSTLLMIIGFFTPILKLVSKENFSTFTSAMRVVGILGCMCVGILIGTIIYSTIMRALFKKAKHATYVWIIGLVCGSVFSLFYNLEIVEYYQKGIQWWEYMLAAFLLVGGFIASYALTLYNRKHKALEEKKTTENNDESRQISK